MKTSETFSRGRPRYIFEAGLAECVDLAEALDVHFVPRGGGGMNRPARTMPGHTISKRQLVRQRVFMCMCMCMCMCVVCVYVYVMYMCMRSCMCICVCVRVRVRVRVYCMYIFVYMFTRM